MVSVQYCCFGLHCTKTLGAEYSIVEMSIWFIQTPTQMQCVMQFMVTALIGRICNPLGFELPEWHANDATKMFCVASEMQLQTIMAYVFSLAPPFTPCSPLRKK
jgi:hypothetical protein